MRCDICGSRNLDRAWILPISHKYEPTACWECVVEESHYAEDEDEPVVCCSCAEVIPEGLFIRSTKYGGPMCLECLERADDNEYSEWIEVGIRERLAYMRGY